eukprot:TRINITY_DN7774_c0_g1_i1.p1 TRINITY_DN7774_c0_g1~~TRINITY_DN7774_c0_g1_i1.p1  ORF type:complete len:285 (-),score=82.21 TRINITY_DN7774_c0_g1_i1:89-943(-)
MIPTEDLYGLLGVDIEASIESIRSAYRKKALKCHPDKNPDDASAIETFHRLSEALKVLTDVEARKAYDNVIKAKKAAALRHKKLDSKRQKLKEDLERREREAEERVLLRTKKTDEDKLAAEIERLRKEGSKELEEQQEIIKSQLFSSPSNDVPNKYPFVPQSPDKLKLKWKKEDPRYNKESLEKMFHKYGDVQNIVLIGKSALIEMKDSHAVSLASQIETGYSDNPLKIKKLSEKAKEPPMPQGSSIPLNENDYETLVMRNLRQAEERKRLIQEMMEKDEATEA